MQSENVIINSCCSASRIGALLTSRKILVPDQFRDVLVKIIGSHK